MPIDFRKPQYFKEFRFGNNLIWNTIKKSLNTFIGEIVRFFSEESEPIVKLEANFTPIQNLNGQEAPYPPGGGKNLWPEYETQTVNEVTLTNDHGKVTINGTATADTYFDLTVNYSATQGTNIYLYAFNPSASSSNRLTMFIISTDGNPQLNIDSADKYSDFVASADLTISKLRLRVPNGVQYTNFVLYPYLQIGGTAPITFAPYANICPISGHTGCDVWDDPKYGGTINWNQLRKDDSTTNTSDGITTAYSSETHLISIKNNSRTSAYSSGSSQIILYNGSVIAGHKYLFMVSETDPGVCVLFMRGGSQGGIYQVGRVGTTADIDVTAIRLRVTSNYDFVTAHPIGNVFSFYLNIIDLTELFGESKADELYAMDRSEPGSAQAWFKTLFTKDYYAYNAGEETCVSAVNGDPYVKVSINFGQTVYGCQLTVFEDGSGQAVAETGNIVYDGSIDETWGNDTASNYGFYVRIPTMKSGSIMDGKASWLLTYTGSGSQTGKPQVRFGSGNDYIYCRQITNNIPGVTDLATWKTFLSENNLQVTYPLAEPITIPLTAQQINTLVGENVVWVEGSSGDITVQAFGTEIV